MSRVRKPANKDAEKPLPHEPDRGQRQPYSKEHEEYSGAGVVRPPEEKVGKRDEPKPPPRTGPYELSHGQQGQPKLRNSEAGSAPAMRQRGDVAPGGTTR